MLVLVGDSTLDNLLWIHDRNPAHCVTGHLQTLLGPGVRVVNLAADGFTSSDVLVGGDAVLSRSVRREAGDPFPPSALRPPPFFAPLEALAALPNASEATVVLSVGGNVRPCDLGYLPHALRAGLLTQGAHGTRTHARRTFATASAQLLSLPCPQRCTP